MLLRDGCCFLRMFDQLCHKLINQQLSAFSQVFAMTIHINCIPVKIADSFIAGRRAMLISRHFFKPAQKSVE
ncbi:Uncharacterised protein [Enterobacter cloacae]|nr:Uncharacterised protein [Enterobacter cloacae]